MSGAVLITGSLWAAQTNTPAQKPAANSASTAHPTTKTKSASTRKRTSTKGKRPRKKTASYKSHGQQKIDPTRAQQIQEALVREHYLSGEPSGVWDSSTEKAMQKFQADNGWQSKTTPDARALIKLGLGPDHDHLLNPDSAMTGPPQARAVTPSTASSNESSNKAQP